MSVIKVEKNKNYTVMSNYHLKEQDMSLKAKGLLSVILSLPEDWNYSIAGLVAICKENETSIKSTLEELKQFGYLKVIKKMPNETSSGRIEYEYIIYEKKQDIEKQEVENLGVEVLGVENQGQLNTNKLSTNELNTNNYKYIVDFLNSEANTNYRHTTNKTQSLIRARMKEGFTLEDFKQVISNKCNDWKGTDFEKYLRPETLFGTKFESYLNSKTKNNNKEDIRKAFMIGDIL